MSRTVADLLVGVLEQIGVKHIFALIGDSLKRSPTRFDEAASNGLASAMKKERRWLPPVTRARTLCRRGQIEEVTLQFVAQVDLHEGRNKVLGDPRQLCLGPAVPEDQHEARADVKFIDHVIALVMHTLMRRS